MSDARHSDLNGAVCTTLLEDGRSLVGRIQGSGGTVKSDKRLRWVLKERLQEAVDIAALVPPYNPADDELPWGRMLNSGMQARHAAQLAVWTGDEDGPLEQRFTTVKVTEIRTIHRGDVLVYERAPRAT